MPHRVLHLSDTHVTGSGFDEDGADALAALDQILRDCRHLAGLDARDPQVGKEVYVVDPVTWEAATEE